MGICEAALKRQCRRQNIKKWPYRQLRANLKRVDQWQRTLSLLQEHAVTPLLPSTSYKAYDIHTVEMTLKALAEQRDTFYDIPPFDEEHLNEYVVTSSRIPLPLLGKAALFDVPSSSS